MFLGVDGGGTKTAFCLLDSSGRIKAQTETGTCSCLSVDVDEMVQVLRRGVQTACCESGITTSDIEYAFFGLPAYGEIPNTADIRRA